MASLTGTKVANSYKDLLKVSNSGEGLTSSLQTVDDGDGTTTPLQLSNNAVNINGTFQLGGTTLTATASELNACGDVAGPASSVDNTIPRFNSTTGKVIQTSGVVIDDSDNLALGSGNLTSTGLVSSGQLTVSGSGVSNTITATANTSDQLEVRKTNATVYADANQAVMAISSNVGTNDGVNIKYKASGTHWMAGIGLATNDFIFRADTTGTPVNVLTLNKTLGGDFGVLNVTTGGEFILDVDNTGGVGAAGAITFGAGGDAAIYYTGSSLTIDGGGTGIGMIDGLVLGGNLTASAGSAWKMDLDGSSLTSAGTIQLGASASDSALYFNGTNLVLDVGTGAIQFSVAGTQIGTWDAGGIDIATGDVYAINGVSILSATGLGTSVVTSSLTTVGALNSGSITSGFGTIDTGASTITTTGAITGGSFKLGATTVLSGTTLGSSIVTSSLTTVGALNSGSITSGFTSIDVGAGDLVTTGTLGGILGAGTPAAATVTTLGVNGDITSDADGTDSIGSTGVRFLKAWLDSLTVTGDVGAATGTFTGEVTATGFTGTLDGILGSGSASAATVTALEVTSLSGTGAVTITDILDEDNMASNSATKLSTQQSIKAYVDAQVDTVDTLAEVLAIGNTSGGTDLAISAGDDITFTDSSKAIFGTGGDLEIYHNGSNTYINETGTGKLIILGTDLTMADTGNAHNYLNAVSGAGVTLYYDNNSRIATTATGVTITGVATATGFTGTLDGVLGGGTPAAATVTTLAATGVATVGNGANGLLYIDGGSSSYPALHLMYAGTSKGFIRGNGATGGVVIGAADSSTAHLTISEAGEALIGTTSTGSKLRVSKGSSSSAALFEGSGYQTYFGYGASEDNYISSGTSGSNIFRTGSAERMRITSSGNVGIGTAAAATTLHVVGDAQITGDTTVSSLNDGHLAGFRNRIINGGFDVEEHTDTAVLSTTQGYICDRWEADINVAGAGTFTFSGNKGKRRLKIQRTNGETGIPIMAICQNIESANCADFAGKNITISFVAKAGANWSGASNGLRMLVRTGSGQDENLAPLGDFASTVLTTSVTHILTTTEATYSYTLALGSTVTQVALQFWPTTAGTAGADDSITIGEIQVEIGDVATPFERRTPGVELALCQRYFEKFGEGVFCTAYGTGAVSGGINYARKRSAPTVSLNTTTPSIYQQSNGTKTASGSVISTLMTPTANGMAYSMGGFSGLVALDGRSCTLRANVFDIDAEL